MASEIEIQRLMCAIRPTRVERLLNAAKVRSWGRSETGLFGWIGNRCDDLESGSMGDLLTSLVDGSTP